MTSYHGDLSHLSALTNLLKALIGMGILSLPYATARVGWLPSILGMLIVAIFSMSGVLLAVMAKERLRSEAKPFEVEGQPVTEKSRLHGPDRGLVCTYDVLIRDVLGIFWQYLFAFALTGGQYATGIVYVKVIAASLGTYWPESILTTYLLIGLTVCLLCMIEKLKGVTYLSVAALGTYAFIVAGLVMSFGQRDSEGTLGATAYMFSPRARDYGEWFGMTCFAFGAFPVAILVYDDMREPKGFFKVTWLSYGITWLFYTAFSLLGYFAFGEKVNQVIYFDFSAASIWRHASLVSIVVILAFSYVLQMMPVFTFAQTFCQRPESPFRALHYSVIRFAINALGVIIAWLMPSVVSIIDTFGAITGVLSGMILPAMLFMKVSSREDWLMHVLCMLLIAFGAVGTVRAVTSH